MKLLLFFYTPLLLECQCHRRIGDGIETDDSTKFPFFAQLQRPIMHDRQKVRKCGGSLIHPRWILTAGHCFPNDAEKLEWVVKQNMDMVFMGSAKAYSNTSAVKNTFVKIYHHPRYRPIRDYRGEIAEYDIALGELKEPYELTRTVQTIRVASFMGKCTKGIMVGVGRTIITDPSSKSKHVKFAELKITKASEINYTFYRTPTTFYTNVEKRNKYTGVGYPLQGDSGGPFFCTIHSYPVQIGVFSGGGYTGKTVFSIYERVDKHLDFIFKHVPGVRTIRVVRAVADANNKKVSGGLIILCFFLVFIQKH